MIGLINRLLFDFVESKWGTEMCDQIRAETGVNHPEFRMDVYYPDSEWQAIYSKAIELSKMSQDELEWEFGIFSGEALTNQFAGFMAGVTTAREMITRQPRVHNTLAMAFHDAEARAKINEKFHLVESDDSTIMHYSSPNKLCVFYKSLAQWVADHFNENIEITETTCMKHGNHECEIHVRYLGKKAAAQVTE